MDASKVLDTLADLLRRERGDNVGAGEHVVRCAPGTAPFRLPASVRRAEAKPVDVDAPAGIEARAKGDQSTDGAFVVEGVASSTSVDWYGTEMSPRALEDMQAQFTRGVDLFPRHGGFLDTVEWDEVVGRTFTGIMQRADVVEAADPSEPGFLLTIQAKVDRSAPRAEELERRLESGQPIGLSIGGWFTEVRYITDEDGEIARIIIERVQLDHLAIVRSPANPDSTGLKILRDAGAKSTRSAAPSPIPAGLTDDLSLRHILRVDVEDDAIVLRLAKGKMQEPEADEEPEDDMTEEGDRSAPVAEVTRDPGIDNTIHPGEDAQGTRGDLPDERSTDMSTEKLDQILHLLGDVKSRQDRTDARLDAIESRGVQAPTATPAIVTIDPEAEAERIARAVASALDARAAGAKPAATAAGEDPSVIELRAKVASLEAERDNRDAALAGLVGSGRIGRGSRMAPPVLGGGFDSEQAALDIDNLVQRCKSDGDIAPILCAVVARSKAAISISREASGHLPKGERGKAYLQAAHNAPSTLRSLLVAAERDGLIGDLDHGWRH